MLGRLLFVAAVMVGQMVGASWRGVLRDAAGVVVAGARIELRSEGGAVSTRTGQDGVFEFAEIAAGRYAVRVEWGGGTADGSSIEIGQSLRITAAGRVAPDTGESEATGGEKLSSSQVSALPLNKRDFGQLLLLAAGTQTDSNGAANFTQQFTVNGQRGAATVFAMDGTDTTDPEMGGATFSNFNVDAIEEIRSSSGVLPAEIGHGAAGFTEVITRSGANEWHGSVFEFVRNAAFDARNFFDWRSVAQPGRIPPFNRNEFGFTNGGAIRRDRTYYFAQYQGFRQVLGTTQVIPVPTAGERAGIDSTAVPGDVLTVPVDSKIAPVLAAYPMPNDPAGPYGARTYAISSKVTTTSDQFSGRFDHNFSPRSHLFARFNYNDVDGPLTNPSQTAIDESFAIRFLDRQRSAGLSWSFAPSAAFTSDTAIGFVRSTPTFPTGNATQPGLVFGDGLYEGFNSASGSIIGAYGNLVQIRQNFTWVRGSHTWKAGVEARGNYDTTLFGTSPNGTYTFGGGTAYSPVEIRSASGLHDIHVGDPLPDALSGFLTGTPFSYTVTAAPPLFGQGNRMGVAAIRRSAYNFYVQDNWKASARVAVSYGVRYEMSSRIGEAKRRTSGWVVEDSSGRRIDPMNGGGTARYLINPQPPYDLDWNGFQPRLAVDWRWSEKTVVRAGASLTTLLLNLWQQNCLTAGLPVVVTPLVTAEPGRPVPFENRVTPVALPDAYTAAGELLYPTGNSMDVAANTELDVMRLERDLAALSPDGQVRALAVQGMQPGLRNGAVGSWTAGIEHEAGDVLVSAAYVATAGMRLARLDSPNGYAGASPEFAPYTRFDSEGRVAGGYGPIWLVGSDSHSSYHSLQASATKKSLRAGLGFQASYTFSKSIDDTSAVLGGFLGGASGTLLQTSPQNPRGRSAEKGPSTFDITHAFSFSAVQELPAERVLGRGRLGSGWQLLAMGSLASGSPFSVFSGIQQTGAGANSADRPDQVGVPVLSTARTVREDYFGLGAQNATLFYIPVGIEGGTGPNSGRFGTLGRNTFRGPAMHNFDVSMIKNTAIGGGANPERIVAQLRAEVFNVFNIVNFGLPSNIVLGPGFGMISRTAGPSRQIQLSLKILY